MYRAEASRKRLLSETTDILTYYKSLEMVLEIRFADDFSLNRISQLTQRTNQFNLTTKRYSESDIRGFMNQENIDVVYLKLQDKFGDSGITGCIILKYFDEIAVFDTFLLSCRILGRGVEDAFLIQSLKLAKNKGAKIAIGEYCATLKNTQVEHFYSQRGFSEIPTKKPLTGNCFSYALEQEIKNEPDYFKQIISEIDEMKRY
jgi:FkbH-like protein